MHLLQAQMLKLCRKKWQTYKAALTEQYQFAKKSSHGVETVEISKNSELFMFVYKTNSEVYQILKNKLLLPSFSYAYAYKNTKYYENSQMRIGLNDNNNILSIFKPLK